MLNNNNVRSRTTIIPGSLATGTVFKTGTGTSALLQVGDRVVLEPGVSCLNCQFCSSGQTHLCTNISYIGTSTKDGALCKFMNHPAYFCHKLDYGVPLDYATLTTKIACAIHCYEKAEISKDSKVLILGSNLLGLITLMVLKYLGVGSVFVAELSNYRLELAKRLGADFVLKLSPRNSPEYPEYLKEIMQAVYTQPPDVTIDTDGSSYSVETSFHLAKSGGKIILMAAKQSTQAPFLYATLREMKVIGCYSYTRRSFLKAINIMKEGHLSLNSISALKVNLNRAIDAFSYHKATIKETVLTIITNEIEKDSFIKESRAEQKTAISRDPSEVTKFLDKDVIQEIHRNKEQSGSQTISELSLQEKDNEMTNSKGVITLESVEHEQKIIRNSQKEAKLSNKEISDDKKTIEMKVNTINHSDKIPKSEIIKEKRESIKDTQSRKSKTKKETDADNKVINKDDIRGPEN